MIKNKKRVDGFTIVMVIVVVLAMAVFVSTINQILNPNKDAQTESNDNQGFSQFSNAQPSQEATQQLTPKQQCEQKGSIWCNGQCYDLCPNGQKFDCPASGLPNCIPTQNIEDNKNSIVYIRYDASGCCDSNGQISSLLGGAGSGVIYYKNDSTVRVLTSRHVVDCVFSGTCIYPTSEKITIRTQNGNFYTPTQIWHAPKNLDLAILEFQTTDNNINPVMLNFQNYSSGDKVTAIGYPAFSVQSTEPVLEFSVTEGSITDIRSLLTYQGLSFTGIQSDALVNHGSSGGGLFNQDGKLTGIITWGDREQKAAIAIDTKVLSEIDKTQEQFRSCLSGSYQKLDERCCYYGTMGSSDGLCYKPCGNPNSICPSPNVCLNDKCYAPCASGYAMGIDGVCYPKCGVGYCQSGSACCFDRCLPTDIPNSVLGNDCLYHPKCGNTLCTSPSVCYNNQCVSCPSGYSLGADGRCYPS